MAIPRRRSTPSIHADHPYLSPPAAGPGDVSPAFHRPVHLPSQRDAYKVFVRVLCPTSARKMTDSGDEFFFNNVIMYSSSSDSDSEDKSDILVATLVVKIGRASCRERVCLYV